MCTRAILTIFDQCSNYAKRIELVFTNKMFEKHLWMSDILKITPIHRYFFFASKKQLPGLSINGTLVKSQLTIFLC